MKKKVIKYDSELENINLKILDKYKSIEDEIDSITYLEQLIEYNLN